jgi:two-component system, NarL family, response regulator NreC
VTTPATVVLADDHQVVREGLRLLLEAQPDLSVVGEAADGLQAADLAERLKPDVLVVDLVMPGLGGLDVARETKKRSPKTRIVILSMHSSDSFVLQALKNGASAYVLKDSSAAELVQAIHTVLAGRRYLSPPLSQKAIDAYVKRAEGTEVDLYETLTIREREVLHLAAEGLGNPAIGERLGISPRTAETHRAHLMDKLGLRNTAALVLYALHRGLVLGTPPDAPFVSRSKGESEG